MLEFDYEKLFNEMHPDFFQRDYIRNQKDDVVFEEMLLALKDYDKSIYSRAFGPEVSFGYYDGNVEELKPLIKEVDQGWPEFFQQGQKIYCGYIDGRVASFCMIEDFGTYEVAGKKVRIGGPGCVGTLPQFRDRGIGLTMINNASRILKEEGYDYSYIHYTGVAGWYAKLGYETILRWNGKGFIA